MTRRSIKMTGSGRALCGRLVSPTLVHPFGSDRLNGVSNTTHRSRTMRDIFRNRIEAGQLLAGKLMRYANQPNVIVLGLPRGGVPVAFRGGQGAARAARCFLRAETWHARQSR